MKTKKISLLALSIVVFGCSPLSVFPKAFADEIVVSGNGVGANSDVQVQSSQNTTIQQSNQVSVANNVSTNASTGDNQASDNNGNAAISTGNVTTDTSITNQANSSAVDTGACCKSNDTSVSVSGNGSGSTNTINTSSSTTINTSTNQTATITNNINGTAVTGNNKASDNQGKVTIITGNISHTETIKTGPLNTSVITVGSSNPAYTISVNGNGEGSVNVVNAENIQNITHTIYSTANIFNDSFWTLLTGGNVANRNNGDVVIKTGGITSVVTIENKANEASSKDECCRKDPPTPAQPTPTPTGSKPGDGGTSGGGSSSGGSGSGSGSSTAAGGSVLPVTGGSFTILFIIGNIIMLFFGVLLRLRSGRSPGFSYNFVL